MAVARHVLVGDLFYDRGELVSALAAYRTALGLGHARVPFEDPTRRAVVLHSVYVRLAQAFREGQDTQHAIRALEAAIRIRPDDLSLHHTLGALHLLQGSSGKE